MMFSLSFVGGSKSAEGGPYPLTDLDRGGPNPLGHRDDVSSYFKYYQLSSEILDYKLILFRSRHHIKLFPQRDEHLFFSVPGVRDH